MTREDLVWATVYGRVWADDHQPYEIGPEQRHNRAAQLAAKAVEELHRYGPLYPGARVTWLAWSSAEGNHWKFGIFRGPHHLGPTYAAVQEDSVKLPVCETQLRLWSEQEHGAWGGSGAKDEATTPDDHGTCKDPSAETQP